MAETRIVSLPQFSCFGANFLYANAPAARLRRTNKSFKRLSLIDALRTGGVFIGSITFLA